MSKELNIYQRMAKITIELQRVAKNLNIRTGTYAYKAVGEADVLDAVKPLEAEYGVYSYPTLRTIIESGTIENESIDYKTKEKLKKSQIFMRIETIYRFVNVDNPSEFVEVTAYGDGVDSQDKAPGKAMTYADKYALMKAYKITTGDDPDQNASDDLKNIQTKQNNQKTATPATTPDETKIQQDTENKAIDRVKLTTLEATLAKKKVPAKQLLDRYKVTTLTEMTTVQWTDAMNLLARVKEKENVNLGL